ncbi:hypothetical protein, partial [Salmonella sp. s57610]|uniref:hypothetical protein n=1 Tax=Salmonella sp. s57610 TaxID=3159697 RepID=UPI00397EB7EE
ATSTWTETVGFEAVLFVLSSPVMVTLVFGLKAHRSASQGSTLTLATDPVASELAHWRTGVIRAEATAKTKQRATMVRIILKLGV